MNEKANPIQSAERIFSVLELLAMKGPLGVTEIANTLGLNKSTVHRLLASLIAMAYVVKDDQTDLYRLTFKILSLSDGLLGQVDVVAIARPYLEQLKIDCQETIHLVQREGIYGTYIGKYEELSSSVRMVSRIGASKPLYCTGFGKAILAQLPDETIKTVWDQSPIEKLTPYTITTFSHFMQEINRIRQQGYALDLEENEIGVKCIAACIFNHKGEANHAFSISAPIARMTDDRLAIYQDMILRVSQDLSQAFGYRL